MVSEGRFQAQHCYREMGLLLDHEESIQKEVFWATVHVLIFWLALLLVRIAEVETGQTWPTIRLQMQQQNLVDLFGRKGSILQHTELTQNQLIILKKQKINPPKRILKADISAWFS